MTEEVGSGRWAVGSEKREILLPTADRRLPTL